MEGLNAKRIVLHVGGRRELGEKLRVHINTVDAALRFSSNSLLQRKIREEAFKMGGKLKGE